MASRVLKSCAKGICSGLSLMFHSVLVFESIEYKISQGPRQGAGTGLFDDASTTTMLGRASKMYQFLWNK